MKISRPWWVRPTTTTDTLAAILRAEARLVQVESELRAIRAALESLAYRNTSTS